jgi:hypothetical protein
LKIIGLAGGQVNEDDPPSVTTHALADKIRNGYWGLISNFDKCLLIVETWPSSLFAGPHPFLTLLHADLPSLTTELTGGYSTSR